MPVVYHSALMPYSAKTMFDIVNDVAAYPEFLPWCGGTKINLQTDELMEASILMEKGRLKRWFSTRNQIVAGERIEVTLIDGPFKSLNGVWKFIDFDSASSKVELDLKFEFEIGIAAVLISPIFTQIANTMVDSFCTRAHQLNQ